MNDELERQRASSPVLTNEDRCQSRRNLIKAKKWMSKADRDCMSTIDFVPVYQNGIIRTYKKVLWLSCRSFRTGRGRDKFVDIARVYWSVRLWPVAWRGGRKGRAAIRRGLQNRVIKMGVITAKMGSITLIRNLSDLTTFAVRPGRR